MELYWVPLRRNFSSGIFSCAFLFNVIMFVILLLVPFFLAYESHSFWLKDNTYREQALVKFEYKIVVMLEGQQTDPTTGAVSGLELFYSTVTSVNNLFPGSIRVPVIRTNESDWNSDGMMDQFTLSTVFPLRCGEEIFEASVAVFFDYTLRERARINTETLALATHSSAFGGQALRLWGDLRLSQRWPFKPTGGEELLSNHIPLLEPGSVHRSSQALLSTIVDRYRSRNVTTTFDAFASWERSAGGGVGSRAVATTCPSLDVSAPPTFALSMDVHIPTEPVLYTPEWTEVLKVAWMQYLSLFVILYHAINRLRTFVFTNQIVETTMRSEAGAGSRYFYTGPKMHAF